MIERQKKGTPFVRIASAVIRRGGLKLEELGLYSVMAAKPDNWEFNEQAMARELHLSEMEIHRMLESMERKGYVRRHASRYGPAWDFFETPCPIAQKTEPLSKEPEQKEPEGEEPSDRTDGEAREMTREQKAQVFFDLAKQLAQNRDMNRSISRRN